MIFIWLPKWQSMWCHTVNPYWTQCIHIRLYMHCTNFKCTYMTGFWAVFFLSYWLSIIGFFLHWHTMVTLTKCHVVALFAWYGGTCWRMQAIPTHKSALSILILLLLRSSSQSCPSRLFFSLTCLSLLDFIPGVGNMPEETSIGKYLSNFGAMVSLPHRECVFNPCFKES